MPSLNLSAGYTDASIWQKSLDCILKQGYIFLMSYINHISIKLVFYKRKYIVSKMTLSAKEKNITKQNGMREHGVSCSFTLGWQRKVPLRV